MARKAEKRRKLGIVDDDAGCPVCLVLDGEFKGWDLALAEIQRGARR